MKYDDYSDEELLRLYREDRDGQIPDYLLEKYKGLVRKKARAVFLAGGDVDDLIQEGMIGLFKAIRDYQEDRQASFATFAGLCIDRQLYHAVQKSNRLKNLPLNTYISLTGEDDLVAGLSRTSDNPEAIVIAREEQKDLERQIEKILSPMEKKVLSRYLSGENYAQIGEALEKPVKSIDNTIQRIRRKVRLLS